jgi:5-methylthioadenosine/S-adenosylhomocysteine deaminase
MPGTECVCTIRTQQSPSDVATAPTVSRPPPAKPHRTLLRGAQVLLGDALAFDRQPRDVLVEGERIGAIERAGTVPVHAADAVVDLTHHLLAPGLVNGHQHSHEHFQRGRTENQPLELWMHLVKSRLPVALNPRQVYLRAMIGAIESLRTGCTTLVDDLALGASIDRRHVDAVLRAYDDIGIRALLGFAMMDRPMVDTFPFVDELVPAALAAELRAAPRPSGEQFAALVENLVGDHHPQQRRVGVPTWPRRCRARARRTKSGAGPCRRRCSRT